MWSWMEWLHHWEIWIDYVLGGAVILSMIVYALFATVSTFWNRG